MTRARTKTPRVPRPKKTLRERRRMGRPEKPLEELEVRHGKQDVKLHLTPEVMVDLQALAVRLGCPRGEAGAMVLAVALPIVGEALAKEKGAEG